MVRRKGGREVVYVERGGDASAKWLFWGAVLGAGLALLYAPRTGEETRRVLTAQTVEAPGRHRREAGRACPAVLERQGGAPGPDRRRRGELDDVGEPPPLRPRASSGSARDELERRLAESRARRRAVGDLEEPLA